MAIYNPLYDEETGWTPLDQLAPWQQALMNPGANNPGMSMPTFDQNNPYYQFTQYGPNQPGALPAGYDPYAISNGIAGVYNGSNLTGSNQGGGTGTNAGQMVDPAVTFNNANRTTSPPPGNTTTRTTTPTPTIASPSLLATNMSMTGAENVGGMGMYTGSNGPLDTNRFTPVQGQQQNGPPPGSIPTGDPNTWITPWGATYTTPGSINNSSSAAYDAYRQRAFGDMMGPMGRGPNTNPYQELTDVLRQIPGSINAQTFQGYLGSLQGQQTGPNPPQQTAPLPPQGGNPPAQFRGAAPFTGTGNGPSYLNQTQNPYAGMQFGPENDPRPEMPAELRQKLAQGMQIGYDQTRFRGGPMPGQNTNQRIPGAGSPVIGSPGMMGPRPIDSSRAGTGYGPPVYQVGANGQRQWQDPRTGQWLDVVQQNGYPWEGLGTSPVMGMPQGYGNGQMQVDPAQNPYQGIGQMSYPHSAQGMQQMAAQFSSDPASQQAYLRDMFGGGQQDPFGWYPQPAQAGGGVDFRAATFGGGSIFPAASGSGNGNTNIPNTTNPSTSQYSQPMAGWSGATNRRGGFGGMSLFGNQFGSGGSTGFGGTQPSQYRGAGSYGRPASYGQSQRPY